MSDLTRKEFDDFTGEMKGIVDKIREKADKYGVDSAEYKRYVENADKKMEELDKKNEELTASIKEKEAKEEEVKKRIEHLETLATMGANKKDEKKDVDAVANAIFKKNWVKFAEKNPNEAADYVKEMGDVLKTLGDNTPAEIKSFENVILNYKAANDLLRTDIGELGGYLVPISWSNRLREQLIEVSPVRRYATVETISGKSIVMPVEQGVPTANYEGETELGADSVPNYTSNTLTPHRLTVTVPATWDMLNNSSYNISNRIMMTARKSFAQKEGYMFVKGNGKAQPLGFTVDANVPIVTSDTATLSMDDVINISGELKQGYKPMYFFNRKTLIYLRTLKDDMGRYLWNAPFGDGAGGVPATINGYAYSSEFIDMDNYNTATGIPILFADMKEFYSITDRTDIVVIRDELTQKKKAIVEFTLMTWNHGQPVVKEAGVLLKLNS